jgi:hypothetical protein
MVIIDADASPELLKTADVSFAPTIFIYRQGKRIMRYSGDWSPGALSELCKMITNDDLHTLTDSFSVFEFQHRNPANIILSSPEFVKKADGLLHTFGGVLQIGVVEDDRLPKALGLPGAALSRPIDSFTINLTDVEESTIRSYLAPRYEHIHCTELFGLTETVNTFLALVKEDDPLMVFDSVSRFEALREVFGANMSFQYCDFFKCQALVNQFKPISLIWPLYVLHCKQGFQQRVEVYPRFDSTVADIVNWAKFQILGIAPPDAGTGPAIPRITAHEFIPVVLDPKRDVVLLVASPRMQLYDVSAENFRRLMKIFEDVSEVAFFEFNPLTEHVKGLEMPKSENPQLSIWPASPEQHGAAFQAHLDIGIIFKNLLQLIKTKPSQEKLAKMEDKLAKLRNE